LTRQWNYGTDEKIENAVNRSFPEVRGFLLADIVGPDYPVKHLIEQARNKGHITKGKRGRGGGVATSRDLAVLLAGTLAGDSPQTASDAMGELVRLMPFVDFFGAKPRAVEGLAADWWRQSLVDVIACLINAWRTNRWLEFQDVQISIIREPTLYGRISWSTKSYEQEEFLSYNFESSPAPPATATGRREISASYGGNTLMLVADWLEGRESY